jgi:hypothetical protein
VSAAGAARRRRFGRFAGLLLGLVALAGGGCATAQRAAMLAEDSLARATAAGYLALDQYDQQKVAGLKAQAEGGDLPGAILEMQKYAAVRTKAVGALDAAADLINSADAARDGSASAAADPRAFLDYAPKFVRAAADLLAALKDAGVPIPPALASLLGALGVK